MVRRRGRWLAWLLLAPLLTGCTISGQVIVRQDDSLNVDLLWDQVTGCTTANFGQILPELAFTVDAATGSCHIVGDVSPSTVAALGVLDVTTAGEYTAARLHHVDDVDKSATVDLVVVMPGIIVANTSGGTVDQDRLTLRSPLANSAPQLQVTSLNHPGPPNVVTWSLAGLAAGGLVAGAVAVVIRRRGHRSAPDVVEPLGVDQPVEVGEAAAGGPPVDVGRPGELVAGPASSHGPPAVPRQPGRRRATGVDTSVWAPPETREDP